MALALHDCLDHFYDEYYARVGTANSDINALQALNWLNLTQKQKIRKLAELTEMLIWRLDYDRKERERLQSEEREREESEQGGNVEGSSKETSSSS